MIPLIDSVEQIRWTSTNFDPRLEVVETVLALPMPTFLALETAARQHHLTVGQMARRLIARGLTGGASTSEVV